MKIILDCDPGHDDAIALMLALASPEVELLGVTTVHGNQTLEKTTINALKLLEFAGRAEIPVAAGADRPFQREPFVAAYVHGESGMDGPTLPPPSGSTPSARRSSTSRTDSPARPGLSRAVLAVQLASPEIAALIAAIAWDLLTWYFGLPSSSSHALVGGLLGAGCAKAGISAVAGVIVFVVSLAWVKGVDAPIAPSRVRHGVAAGACGGGASALGDVAQPRPSVRGPAALVLFRGDPVDRQRRRRDLGGAG